jgi:hypothetical protein
MGWDCCTTRKVDDGLDDMAIIEGCGQATGHEEKKKATY